MTKIQMSFAMSPYPRSRPVLDGRVMADGIDFICHSLTTTELFWRQLRFQEFDVSEMSLSSFVMIMAAGNQDWIGLPVFPQRRFFHVMGYARKDSGIRSPADYKGRRIGVLEFQMTGALWVRGAMKHEFGCNQEDVDWWMEFTPEHSHGGATGFTPPKGTIINQIPHDKNIGSMLVSGELDATCLYFGTPPNMIDRTTIDITRHPDIVPVFSDPGAESIRYFQKTGIFPINHMMVLRRSLHEKYPWAALSIYKAMSQAAAIADRERVEHMQHHLMIGAVPPSYRAAIGAPVIHYGIKANRRTLEQACDYSYEQGLTPRRMAVDSLFAATTLSE
ncbi:MAG TPA: hypothetical protein VNF99_07565 [Stellaceae bacterium]|nr:hypothetical protein [Stellaceae bacterium]